MFFVPFTRSFSRDREGNRSYITEKTILLKSNIVNHFIVCAIGIAAEISAEAIAYSMYWYYAINDDALSVFIWF